MDLFLPDSSHNVLAIFAHPDDAEAAAGGTLALYSQLGAKVSSIIVALGEKGRGESGDRDLETQKAADILGIDHIENLGYKDGEFDNDLGLRKILTEKIRFIKPDVVIAPDPTAVFFSHLYVNHRDHRHTGWAVLDVVSSAVNNPKYFSNSNSHDVQHLLCAGTLEPNCVVDISTTINKKIESVLCYESQIGDNADKIEESVLNTSLKIGELIGVNNAEAYRYCALGAAQEQL